MQDSAQAVPYSRRLRAEESYRAMGYLVAWLAEGKDTGGGFALVEAADLRSSEPPPGTRPTISWRAR